MQLTKTQYTTSMLESQIYDTDDKHAELYDELSSFMRMLPDEQEQWIKDNEINDDMWMNLAAIVMWKEL